MERPHWAPGDIDLERPSVARVYDYWLGGAHNFAADRAVAQQAMEKMPDLRGIVLNHRAFLGRAVRYLLGRGVRQFLDLGSGIPTVGNVHEIAQSVDPAAKVVYVDIDAVAVAHSRSLLDGNKQASVLHADIRDPAAVLASVEVNDLLDFEEPIGVLMIALLHFVSDQEKPLDIIGGYRDRLAPGSFLAISHAGYEAEEETDEWREARRLYERSVTNTTLRNEVEVARLFDGFELVEPGVVRLPAWRPQSPDDLDGAERSFPGFCAVGRKV
ncbi:SAM-dependent methyltransferase [Lentzea sp. NPDC051213]|uniref:SAM-dependent methyltransferase n=1 Tax=Lentzea sp. NPDC051213 TaxID=3364126 RepID=UPI0037B66E80